MEFGVIALDCFPRSCFVFDFWGRALKLWSSKWSLELLL